MNITDLRIDCVNVYKDIIIFNWSANIGFGELTIYHDGESWVVDTECLGKEFANTIVNKWLDTMVMK